MANSEQLEILEQGVEEWNGWRKQHNIVMPNLVSANLADFIIDGADLRNALLNDANLHRISLRNANLSGSNLTDTRLTEAKLTNSNLSNVSLQRANVMYASMNYVNLTEADLWEANLSGADLSHARLEGARLGVANFSEANVKGANFSGALMLNTVFTNTNLSEVRNLEFVRHFGPSSIGIDTIYESGGNIPEAFLRGCGVPEDFIIYMRSLTAKAIEFYSCFISYSSKDEEFARRLHSDLQSEGVRCWFAPEDLKIGEKFRVRIDESIRLYDKLLLVLSENSVTSEWVEKEVETAFEKEREQKKTVLFPVRVDDAVLEARTGWAADIKRSRHVGDFRDWKNHDSYRKAFERLMRDLKAEAGR